MGVSYSLATRYMRRLQEYIRIVMRQKRFHKMTNPLPRQIQVVMNLYKCVLMNCAGNLLMK